jgi:hypothetical protein
MQTITGKKLPAARHASASIMAAQAALDAARAAEHERAVAGLMSITQRAWGLGSEARHAKSSRASE